MVVTDRVLCGGADGLAAAVEAAVSGGADAVQLREKDPDGRSLPASELSTLARRLRAVTQGQALLLVNGPLEVAVAVGADGVHLPEGAPMPPRPRRGFLVGRSVHSAEAACRPDCVGADYLIAGPIFETRSHPGVQPAGLALVEEIARAVRVPVLAIGGVTAGRVEEVVRAGASGVAVISAVLAQPDPRAAAEALRRALDAAWSDARAARR
ncbi:MAG: thiamine phosphate synthase [Dehalococcoidia bacterium]|nr:thiamine phosphate synthase [Dehalococcoidia bacterium]